MLYEKEYLTTRKKNVFMALMRKRYPHLKDSSIERRYYDCRKALGEQPQHHYPPEEKSQPQHQKMFIINDMKRFKTKITREVLTKYGFTKFEINWLEDEGEIVNGV